MNQTHPRAGRGRVPGGAWEAGGTPGERGQGRQGEQRLSSARAEGAGEGAPGPSRGVAAHMPRFCPSAPAKVRAQHPKTRDDAGERVGSIPCTQSPAATGHTSPESPNPSCDSHCTSHPLPIGQTPVLLFFKLSLCTG